MPRSCDCVFASSVSCFLEFLYPHRFPCAHKAVCVDYGLIVCVVMAHYEVMSGRDETSTLA